MGFGATLNVACDAPTGVPPRDRAAAFTRIATLAPYAKGFAGWNTRTVPSSAQLTLPATRWPLVVTANAAAVAARFMGWVNRTDRIAPRSIRDAPLTGRKRTTDGALAVETSTAAASIGTPSSSTRPSNHTR